jgi:chromosome segregation ATPase
MNLKDAQLWLSMGVGIVVWAFTAGVIWTSLNNRIDNNKKDAEAKADTIKKDAENKAKELTEHSELEREKLRNQINGLGGRLKVQEEGCAGLGGRMESAERQLGVVVQQNADVNTRLGKVEARVEAVDSHMTEFKLELFQHLGEMRTLISSESAATRQIMSDRDANLRERVARVEERRNIPHVER